MSSGESLKAIVAGNALDLADLQYGAWIGTGLLNSDWVLAATLAKKVSRPLLLIS